MPTLLPKVLGQRIILVLRSSNGSKQLPAREQSENGYKLLTVIDFSKNIIDPKFVSRKVAIIAAVI